MLYYVLISVVIVAEIIIAAEITVRLIKWNKNIKETNNFLEEAKPKVKSIFETGTKITEQLTELSPMWVEKIKNSFIGLGLKPLKSAFAGFCVWLIRKELKKN